VTPHQFIRIQLGRVRRQEPQFQPAAPARVKVVVASVMQPSAEYAERCGACQGRVSSNEV
jgi:hypothetical protein